MLDTLLRASLDGAVLVAVVWIVIRVLPILSPSARAALWWCAAAKFVIGLIWTMPVDVAVLPPPTSPAALVATSAARTVTTATSMETTAVFGHDDERGTSGQRGSKDRVESMLLAAWGAGLVIALGTLGRKWRRTAAIVRRAAPAPAHIHSAIAELAARVALRRAPDARISGELDTPLVTGFTRPTVLLPARFMDLPPSQQRMALCHELTHITRGDLWIGCVPALAERLFFFHPLVHLAAREYVFWRESACDAAVLEALDAAPHEYGRLLLDLGIASPRASLAAAGASWSFSNLKRRIHMLGDLPRASRSRTSRLVAAAAVLLALAAVAPLRLVARAPVQPDPRASVPPVAAAQPPSTPKAPRPPERPADAARQRPDRSEARELDYVLFRADAGDNQVHMSGSRADVERARSFRRGNEPLLWFRDRRGEFVVRDATVLRQVEALWKPVAELGAKQGRLGAEQGKLGSKMGELGGKQGLLGAEQGRIGARQGALGASQGELAAQEWNASDARRAEIEKVRRQLETDMRALDAEMKALDVKMREFEKPMRELGTEMEALGNEMKTLGRQLEQEVERARTELRTLLDRAVASGTAQAVK